jgi:hypothetical protein
VLLKEEDRATDDSRLPDHKVDAGKQLLRPPAPAVPSRFDEARHRMHSSYRKQHRADPG